MFSRARVTALGSLDDSAEAAALLGATVIPWTQLQQSDDIFAEVEVRGVLVATTEIRWLSGDAEIVEPPRYADLPGESCAAGAAHAYTIGRQQGRHARFELRHR